MEENPHKPEYWVGKKVKVPIDNFEDSILEDEHEDDDNKSFTPKDIKAIRANYYNNGKIVLPDVEVEIKYVEVDGTGEAEDAYYGVQLPNGFQPEWGIMLCHHDHVSSTPVKEMRDAFEAWDRKSREMSDEEKAEWTRDDDYIEGMNNAEDIPCTLRADPIHEIKIEVFEDKSMNIEGYSLTTEEIIAQLHKAINKLITTI